MQEAKIRKLVKEIQKIRKANKSGMIRYLESFKNKVINLIEKGSNPRVLGQAFDLNPNTLRRWVDSQNRCQFREVKVPRLDNVVKINVETPSGINISFENIEEVVRFVQIYEKGVA